MLIGLTGKSGSGKSFIAKYLETEHQFKTISFAYTLKQACINAGFCTHEEAYNAKPKRTRDILQKIGSAMREIEPDYWINKIEYYLGFCLCYNRSVVIDDVRYLNEAEFIKSQGGIIVRLKRNDYQNENCDNTHASETELELIKPDYEITADSGDLNKLFSEIKGIVKCQSMNINAKKDT